MTFLIPAYHCLQQYASGSTNVDPVDHFYVLFHCPLFFFCFLLANCNQHTQGGSRQITRCVFSSRSHHSSLKFDKHRLVCTKTALSVQTLFLSPALADSTAKMWNHQQIVRLHVPKIALTVCWFFSSDIFLHNELSPDLDKRIFKCAIKLKVFGTRLTNSLLKPSSKPCLRHPCIPLAPNRSFLFTPSCHAIHTVPRRQELRERVSLFSAENPLKMVVANCKAMISYLWGEMKEELLPIRENINQFCRSTKKVIDYISVYRNSFADTITSAVVAKVIGH